MFPLIWMWGEWKLGKPERIISAIEAGDKIVANANDKTAPIFQTAVRKVNQQVVDYKSVRRRGRLDGQAKSGGVTDIMCTFQWQWGGGGVFQSLNVFCQKAPHGSQIQCCKTSLEEFSCTKTYRRSKHLSKRVEVRSQSHNQLTSTITLIAPSPPAYVL